MNPKLSNLTLEKLLENQNINNKQYEIDKLVLETLVGEAIKKRDLNEYERLSKLLKWIDLR